MTIALRSTTTAFRTTTGSSLTINTPAGAAVGDVLFAQITHTDAARTVTAPAATGAGTWVSVGRCSPSASGSSSRVTSVFYMILVGAPAANYTFTVGASRASAGGMTAWTGVDLTNPLGDYAELVDATSDTSANFPSVTPYFTKGVRLNFGGAPVTMASVTPAGGMTELYDLVSTTGTNDVLAWASYATFTVSDSTPLGTQTATGAVASTSTGQSLLVRSADASSINRPPVANAGIDQRVDSGDTVTLNGTGTTDPDVGDTLTYAWTQTAGVTVTLSDASAASPTFTAPGVNGAVSFQLTVTDADDETSSDTVNVIVKDQPIGYYKRPGGWVPAFAG